METRQYYYYSKAFAEQTQNVYNGDNECKDQICVSNKRMVVALEEFFR